MDLSLFDYELPEESIAQEPLPDRGASRMLVVDRRERRWEDRMFRELPEFLGAGDCLALNDSKVFPSRLFGRIKHSTVEVFLLRPVSGDAKRWEALVRPGRKMRVGEWIRFDGGELEAEIEARGEFGERTIRFDTDQVYAALDEIGHVPLPPYIKRADTAEDRERYQTVFARERGSVAAPTAGLHFTPEILEACRRAGAEIATVTLHVGLGTFQPVRGERLHAEAFSVSEQAALTLRGARRVVCVGTTSVRAIESWALGLTHQTDLFIQAGFQFRVTGAMLTNFHLPQSSLLMLVCAFAGRELVLEAYEHAVKAGYRFYSYGDCMLVL